MTSCDAPLAALPEPRFVTTQPTRNISRGSLAKLNIFKIQKMTESASKREYKRDANGKRVGRPRPLPAHVNARNLAIEKQRRQSLNEKFLVGFYGFDFHSIRY